MIRRGEPPYLECSSVGDKRFSAFHARPSSLAGKSIEEAFQALKVLADGRTGLTWREAKGKPAVNRPECSLAYAGWWVEWVKEQNLGPVLLKASGLSDRFGQPGHICQAVVLWGIRAALEYMTDHPALEGIEV